MINILGVQKENTCCPKCKENYVRYEQRDIHIGKYCNNCNRWIKWISKSDVPAEFLDKLQNNIVNNQCNETVELDNVNTEWGIAMAENEEDDLPWY